MHKDLEDFEIRTAGKESKEREYRSVLTAHKHKKIDPTPFDRDQVPPRQNAIAMPFLWAYCKAETAKYGLKIHKQGCEGLKPPYLVLASHHSFMDFLVTPMCLFPYKANYISELEGFEYYTEWPYRQIGCLGTRKFINDMALIRNIVRVIRRGDIMVIYPAARYSNVGTNSKLPSSVAKLCRMLKVPVVTLNMRGNYLQSPIWNLTFRKEARLDAVMKLCLTPEDMKGMTNDEITARIQADLTYDDYQYQKDENIRITYPNRAEGLEHPLYMCQKCGSSFTMSSKGAHLICGQCGADYEMDELGQLYENGEDPDHQHPIHIPDYYEWERQQVEEEIENGEYHLRLSVDIEALPNAKNFIHLGEGRLEQKPEGFYLRFADYGENEPSVQFFEGVSMPSIHTEYNYRGMGPCVTLSTPNNTYFLFPLEEGFSPTKIQFATEYYYRQMQQHKKHKA